MALCSPYGRGGDVDERPLWEATHVILLGCLLALGIAVAPRLMLILAWFFSDRWPIVWQGAFLVPLLGIIFLPFTTIMYMLTWTPRGIEGWDWL